MSKYLLILCSVVIFFKPYAHAKDAVLEMEKIRCEGEFYGDQKKIAKCRQLLLELRIQDAVDQEQKIRKQEQNDQKELLKLSQAREKEIAEYKQRPLPAGTDQENITLPHGSQCLKSTIYDIWGRRARVETFCDGN